jgi:hypothetical protein
LIENLAQNPWIETAFAARTRLILKGSQSAFDKASSPLNDLILVHTHPLTNCPDTQPFSRQLYHPSSLRQSLRRTLRAYQLPKLLFFSTT